YVKNPDYFVKGRPYLGGLRYLIIGERGTATAALQAGRVDTAFPGQTPKPIAERLKKAVPQLVMTPVNTSVVDHLVVNTQKPPFDNAKVRLALSRAIDRRALIDAVYQGGAVLGASMASPPYGVWGLLDKDIRALPGNGKAADEKARARTLLAEAGFGPKAPLRLEILTRALPDFLDVASFVINELKHVGVAAGLLHGLAVCEEPGSSPIHIQLGPHAGGVARQVTYARCSSRAGDTRMWPHRAEDPVLGRADESSLCQNYRPATVAIGRNR